MNGKKLFSILAILLTCILYSHNTYAVSSNNQEAIESNFSDVEELLREEIENQQQKEIFLGETYSIKLDSLDNLLTDLYPQDRFSYVWEIFGDTQQEGKNLDITFSSVGKKQISLQIFKESLDGSREQIHTLSLFPFVYQNSIPFIIDPNISDSTIQNYMRSAEDAGVLLIWLNKDTQNSWNIAQNYNKITEKIQNKANYITLWGEKDFIFGTITELQSSQNIFESNNFVLVTGYNNRILQNYIENSLSGKSIIKQGFILDELDKSQILKYPNMIGKLETGLSSQGYEYTPLRNDIEISPILFISQFVSNLSNTGVKNTDIYIILLLPIFLTFVAVGKHIIGFSTLGNIIPVFLAIMFLKLGLGFSLIVLGFLLVFNILIARFLSKYTLLYTPKLVCITIANILFFMLFYQGVQYFTPLELPHSGILYIVIFFIICEKLISIITTKEFREYKKSIWGTLMVSLLCFSLFYFDRFLVFLFAYPEILLILVPLNFFLGRFTGLRITEYFRFGDIMKNIEEE